MPSYLDFCSVIGSNWVCSFEMDEATVWFNDAYHAAPRPFRAYWRLSEWFIPVGGRSILTARLPDAEGKPKSVSAILLKYFTPHVIWVNETEVASVYKNEVIP